MVLFAKCNKGVIHIRHLRGLLCGRQPMEKVAGIPERVCIECCDILHTVFPPKELPPLQLEVDLEEANLQAEFNCFEQLNS